MTFVDVDCIKDEIDIIDANSPKDVVEDQLSDSADSNDNNDDDYCVDDDDDDDADDDDLQCLKSKALTVKKEAVEPVVKSITEPSTSNENKSYARGRQKAAGMKVKTKVKYHQGPRVAKQCNVCGVIVKRLKDHVAAEHPNAIDYKCLKCRRTYLTQNGLDRHTYNHHPDDEGYE